MTNNTSWLYIGPMLCAEDVVRQGIAIRLGRWWYLPLWKWKGRVTP